jgi:hypothetical protein
MESLSRRWTFTRFLGDDLHHVPPFEASSGCIFRIYLTSMGSHWLQSCLSFKNTLQLETMKRFFPLTTVSLLFLFFLSACSAVREMEVHVPKPTLIPLPTDVKRLVLVDRSQGNAVTAIEGILTGEMVGVDKQLAQECLTALVNPFLTYSTVQVSRHPDRLKSAVSSSTGFGAPMTWSQLKEIAASTQADAVLVLEYFDSDFTIRNAGSANKVGVVLFQGYAEASAGI